MAIIKLTVYVPKLENVLSLFDSLAIERSHEGISGPFYAITAPSASSASIQSEETGPYTLNGLSMLIKLNDVEHSVSFVTADPIAADDVADYLNAAVSGLSCIQFDNGVLLRTTDTGTATTLEVVSGSALSVLGFDAGEWASGLDQHKILSASTDEYEYDDESGETTFYYRTRFYSSISETYSTYSDPVLGSIGSIIPGSDLITAKIDLASVDGSPLANRVVVFSLKSHPLVVASSYLIAESVSVETDESGHAEVNLVKGSRVEVAISGTAVVREIDVPTTGSEFSVVDAIAAADDAFQIQIPDIPSAVRRSL